MKTNRQDLALRQNLLKRKQQMKARHLSLNLSTQGLIHTFQASQILTEESNHTEERPCNAVEKKGESDVFRQIPLLPLPEIDYKKDAFLLTSAHENAFYIIDQPWPTPWSLIEGEHGSGKTHLAHIWQGRCLKVADIESWLSTPLPPGQHYWIKVYPEINLKLLFHSLNHVKNQACFLLLLSLPGTLWQETHMFDDLTSRLHQGLRATIGPPNGDLFQGVLLKNLRDLEYTITTKACQYLTNRIPRSYQSIAKFISALRARVVNGEYPTGVKITTPLLRSRFAPLVEFALKC